MIVLRKDLGMRQGKAVAQGAHASMKVFFDRGFIEVGDDPELPAAVMSIDLDRDMLDWVTGGFAKITVYVESQEALEAVYQQALDASLPCAMIIDSGRTEFHGVPTKTAVAIGPAKSYEIDEITGDLPLL